MCTGTAELTVGDEIITELSLGQQSRVRFDCPVDGITIKICASGGRIQAFGSYCAKNPNSALNDFSLTVEEGECDDIYLPCDRDCNDTSRQRKRQVDQEVERSLNIIIEGAGQEGETNSFVLETTSGDTSTPKGILNT